jgi:hypothetical protein
VAALPASVDILIRSYYRDARWLALALRSIETFVSGYRRVVVVLPVASAQRIDLAALAKGTRVRMHACENFPDDYVGQQITKLHADRYSDADVITVMDSDQVFVASCDLTARLFDGGVLRMAFASRSSRPAGDGWRRCPHVFLGRPIPVDLTMPGPFAIPGGLCPSVRAFCEREHGRSIREYALALPAGLLCEMALLRAYALVHEPGRYAWIDASTESLLPECRTFWSRSQTPADVADALPAALAAACSWSP